MKLQAVVEQLQKQQKQQQQQQQQQPAVPMDCRERPAPFPKPPFPAQPRAGPAAMSPAVPSACHPPPSGRPLEQSARNSEEEDEEDDEEEEDEEEDEDELEVPGRENCSALKYFRAPTSAHPNQRVACSPVAAQQGKEEQGRDSAKHPAAPGARPPWRLEEQLKQNGSVSWNDEGDGCRGREISRDFAKLYELDSDPERKEFLDDLFIFMQKRGDYRQYLSYEGAVDDPLRTFQFQHLSVPIPRYMKYLYAYECEKKSLSSPAELQAAIDGNRREGRRPSYSSSMFSFSPSTPGPPSLLSPPKIRFPIIGVAPGSGTSSPRVSPAVRKGQRGGGQGAVAARTATLEQLRERLEAGEPPEKKATRMTEEEQRLVQQALQRNLLSVARQIPMKIKINGKDKGDSAAALNLTPNGIGSINMSVEINGTTYAAQLCLTLLPKGRSHLGSVFCRDSTPVTGSSPTGARAAPGNGILGVGMGSWG
uniref:AT-rich interactive domain-containing protein 3 n=1 Tax=Ficedula albicollis TaxID=59894 RepID=U3JPS7_FICAL